MRLFFLMLLLLNGAFFAVNALHEPEEYKTTYLPNSSIPELVLLSELKDVATTNAPITTEITETSEPNEELQEQTSKKEEESLDLQSWLAKFTAERESSIQQPQEEPNNKEITQCYTAGPFEGADNLQQAKLFFSGSNINTQQRSIVENHYIGMLVYLPSQPDRQSIITIAEDLASNGVKDYMLLNEPGKRNSLSLGVYGLKKNAEKRMKAIEKYNYSAKSEARYRQKTIYWLDYALSENDDQTELSAQQMKNLNASQIKRECAA